MHRRPVVLAPKDDARAGPPAIPNGVRAAEPRAPSLRCLPQQCRRHPADMTYKDTSLTCSRSGESLQHRPRRSTVPDDRDKQLGIQMRRVGVVCRVMAAAGNVPAPPEQHGGQLVTHPSSTPHAFSQVADAGSHESTQTPPAQSLTLHEASAAQVLSLIHI